MAKEEKIDYIINNSKRFDDSKRSLLESLPEIDLDGVIKLVNREFEDDLQEALSASY